MNGEQRVHIGLKLHNSDVLWNMMFCGICGILCFMSKMLMGYFIFKNVYQTFSE